MLKTEFDESWKSWIALNLERGCSKEGMYEILLEHEFAPELAAEALGMRPLPTPVPAKPVQPVLVETELTEAPDRVELPFAVRFPTDRLELYMLSGFLSETECMTLIHLINQHLRASTTTNDGGEYAGYRTSRTCDLGMLDHPLARDVDRRICQVMGIDSSWSETIQAQRYDVGQQFKAHTDYFEPNSHEFETYATQVGQRTWTFMIYLNSTREGGSTRFTELDCEVRPKQGDAVIWNSLRADGSPNPDTMHWGMPVEKGYKVILTKWFRNKGKGKMFTKTPNEYLPPHTQSGFLKLKMPQELFQRVEAFYRDHGTEILGESVKGFIDAAKGKVASELVPLDEPLKKDIHETLQPLMEAWIGDFLLPTFVYGIRRYRDTATLKMHRDRGITHIASAIVNVAQDVDEPWPLQIEDHFGRMHDVLLEPGEMVFYEGARLLHGRIEPLRGRAYANLFVHYKLRDA